MISLRVDLRVFLGILRATMTKKQCDRVLQILQVFENHASKPSKEPRMQKEDIQALRAIFAEPPIRDAVEVIEALQQITKKKKGGAKSVWRRLRELRKQ